MNDNEAAPFTTDDAALIIGRLVIENHVLRQNAEQLRKEIGSIKDKIQRVSPNLVIVERAQEPGDAAEPGQVQPGN